MYDIAFLHEEFLCLCAYCFDDRVCQQFLFIEALDTFIQIYACCACKLIRLFRIRCKTMDTYLEGRAFLGLGQRERGCEEDTKGVTVLSIQSYSQLRFVSHDHDVLKCFMAEDNVLIMVVLPIISMGNNSRSIIDPYRSDQSRMRSSF